MRTIGTVFPVETKETAKVAPKKATKADLIEQAKAMGLEVSASMTVAQIKKAIEEA